MTVPDQTPVPWTQDLAPYPSSRPAAPAGPRPHPRSGLALGLGLVGIIGSILVLPLLVSPLACYFGAKARRDIEAEPTRWSGRSNATSGLVLGTLGTVLLGLMALGALAVAGLVVLTLSIDTGY